MLHKANDTFNMLCAHYYISATLRENKKKNMEAKYKYNLTKLVYRHEIRHKSRYLTQLGTYRVRYNKADAAVF